SSSSTAAVWTPPTLRAAAPSSASCCRPDRPSRSPGGPRRRRRSAPGPPRQGHHGPPPRPSPRPLGRVRRRRASTHMRGPRRCRPASRSGRSAEATPHAPRSGGSRPQPWRACAPGTHAASPRSSVVFACAPATEMRKPWPRVRPSGAVPRDVSRSAMSPSVTGRPVGSHPCQPTSLPSAHTVSRGGGLVAMSADYCRRTEGTALQDDLGAEDGQDREDGGDLGSGRSGLHAGDRRLAQSGQAAELRLRQPPLPSQASERSPELLRAPYGRRPPDHGTSTRVLVSQGLDTDTRIPTHIYAIPYRYRPIRLRA